MLIIILLAIPVMVASEKHSSSFTTSADELTISTMNYSGTYSSIVNNASMSSSKSSISSSSSIPSSISSSISSPISSSISSSIPSPISSSISSSFPSSSSLLISEITNPVEDLTSSPLPSLSLSSFNSTPSITNIPSIHHHLKINQEIISDEVKDSSMTNSMHNIDDYYTDETQSIMDKVTTFYSNLVTRSISTSPPLKASFTFQANVVKSDESLLSKEIFIISSGLPLSLPSTWSMILLSTSNPMISSLSYWSKDGDDNIVDCKIHNLTASPLNISTIMLNLTTHGNCINISKHVLVDVYNVTSYQVTLDRSGLSLLISGLPHPGHDYNLTITLGQLNESVTTFTVPDEPRNLTVTKRTTNKICFSWKQLKGFHGYMINIDEANYSTFKYESTLNSDLVNGCIGNISGRDHNITMMTIFRNKKSAPVCMTFVMKPAAPNITVFNQSIDSICLGWLMKQFQDGTRLEITCSLPRENFVYYIDQPTKYSSHCIDMLLSGTLYKVAVIAVDMQGNETIKSDSTELFIYTEPQQPTNMMLINRNESALRFSWSIDGNFDRFSASSSIFFDYKCNFVSGSNSTTCQAEVINLERPGNVYNISIIALVGREVKSKPQYFVDWTAPDTPDEIIEVINRTASSFCIKFAQMKFYEDFDCKIDKMKCQDFTFHELQMSNTSFALIHGCLKNLKKAGNLYIFSLSAVVKTDLQHISSKPRHFSVRTSPPKPNLQCVNINTSYISLQLNCPYDSISDGFIIEYNSTNQNFKQSHTFSNATFATKDHCSKTLFVSNLISGLTYQFGAILLVDGIEGERSEFISCTTIPNSVTDLKQLNITSTSFSITWNKPVGHYDYLSILCLRSTVRNNCPLREIKYFDIENQLTFTDLIPGSLHTIQIETRVNASNITSLSKLNLVTVPLPPTNLSILQVTTSTIKIKISYTSFCTHFKVNITSSKVNQIITQLCTNPEIIFQDLQDDEFYNVYVYVVSNYLAAGEGLYMESNWLLEKVYTMPSSVKSLNYSITSWNEITLKWVQPDNHKNIQHYWIFIDQEKKYFECDKSTCDNTEVEYSIRNLELEHLYNISVAPHNPAGIGRVKFVSVRIPRLPFPTWGIALVALSIVLLLLVAFLLIWRRDRFFKPCQPLQAQPAGEVMTITDMSHQAPLPIKIEDFPSEVDLKHKDSEYLFSREYEFLSEISTKHAATIAEKPENRVKNRFVNILAFDHSRVKLSTGEMTETGDVNDYINANFIPGFFSKREYIACQGPMRSTIDHFWQMIWDQKVSVVVMLTKLFEKGKEKCSQYWPDVEECQTYGEIQVKLLTVSSLNYYELRVFQITFGTETRVLQHFWFLNWPDFGVPINEELLSCVKDVRQMSRPHSNSPQVVHCSAGVGRTGTYILLDRALHALERDLFIDIFGMVREMREFRCRMVQTEPQYIFVHDCIKGEILRKKSRELEVVYVNQSFSPEPNYLNLPFHSSEA